ncbi:MAG: hypothetical protein JXA08_06815 [Methanomicrobiaceae archaeon]|nr:hypothetical protein [Methanomicrobiaceae archaeon]
MISKAILDDDETFSLLLQLTDIAAAAHERGDYEKRDQALDEIRQLREKITRIKLEEEQAETTTDL